MNLQGAQLHPSVWFRETYLGLGDTRPFLSLSHHIFFEKVPESRAYNFHFFMTICVWAPVLFVGFHGMLGWGLDGGKAGAGVPRLAEFV